MIDVMRLKKLQGDYAAFASPFSPPILLVSFLVWLFLQLAPNMLPACANKVMFGRGDEMLVDVLEEAHMVHDQVK